MKTPFEIGHNIATALFDQRSRGREQRNVEVHLSHGELADLLVGAASMAQRFTVEDIDTLAAVAHERWVRHMRESGITSRPSVTGEETLVPFKLLSEIEKEQPRAVVRAILVAIKEGR